MIVLSEAHAWTATEIRSVSRVVAGRLGPGARRGRPGGQGLSHLWTCTESFRAIDCGDRSGSYGIRGGSR